MMPTRQGSFRLFRFAGVDVFLHWSWFVVALFEFNSRGGQYSSPTWNVLEYLSLFLIVLLHEFGHALACRQVGGQANQIVLWPLGGVAYVAPPQRPGAMLWSIAAGPLVNVALVPVLMFFGMLSRSLGWAEAAPNASVLLRAITFINFGLLFFNLLPIYPLDGGQILRSLLWFAFGRARSLMAASIIGFAGVAIVIGLVGLAVLVGGARLRAFVWLGIILVFILLNCWGGLMQARALARAAAAPRHEGFTCPDCGMSPPVGAYWLCGRCQKAFDTFLTQAVCPQCGARFAATKCLDCGSVHPVDEWMVTEPTPPRL